MKLQFPAALQRAHEGGIVGKFQMAAHGDAVGQTGDFDFQRTQKPTHIHGGGFALGVALNKSGLAQHMIDAIPFASWSPLIVIIGSGLLCYAMANFISHTATAALLVPILAAVAVGLMNDPVSAEALGSVGGVATLLVGVAIASSVGMVLPISTPPNALAYATGLIEQKHMVKVGLIIGIVSLLLGYTVLYFLGSNGLL